MFLIQLFSNIGFTDKKLEMLNRYRLYLQVTTLSDIVNGLGNSIYILAYKGLKILLKSQK